MSNSRNYHLLFSCLYRSLVARLSFVLATCVFVLALCSSAAAQKVSTPRERSSLNEGWRFQKGDPSNAEGQLAYEKIKAWMIATGNEFVMNPDAAKPSRPEGSLGANISYAQRDFDDRGWRLLNLP